MCITGEAASGTIISPEPILECSRQGCNGGYPSTAWNYMINKGDTTCTKQCFSGCAPYDSGSGSSPACHAGTCDSGSSYPITYYAGSFQSLSGISTYQSHLQSNGPLQACFTVYNNFYTFFSAHPNGIYTSAANGVVGGHCVKMIGWGTDGSTDYWTFTNSWDTTWGDSGYFRMKRGTDLCGIEDQISEGFTKRQAAAFGVSGISVNATSMKMVGGWYEQEDVEIEFVAEAIHETMRLLSVKEGRELKLQRIISVKTQAVAGVNFKMVLGMENTAVEVQSFRDLSFRFHLV